MSTPEKLNKVLIQFAHPAYQKSRAGRALVSGIQDLPGVTFRDLYELYPDQLIDVKEEQRQLLSHDVIVFQHPFYWYSTPALLKEWSDLVLEYDFAYGPKGDRLHGKKWLQVCTMGGPEEVYQRSGYNYFSVRELMAPLEQTARLCGMSFEEPFTFHGAGRASDEDLKKAAERYRNRIEEYLK